MPADVDFMPLAFEAAQGAFAQFAQIAQGRRVADEGVDFLARGRGDFDGRINQFEFLHDDAFGLEEMIFIRRPEFFGARDVDEVVELFPALDVSFDLGDELVEFFGGHKHFRLAWAKGRIAGKEKQSRRRATRGR